MLTITRRVAATGLAAALGATGAAVGAVQAQAAPTAVRTCTTGDLYLSMGAQDHGAGQLYWPVRFTNTSTSRCALRGFPGVSVLDLAHHQIGAAATHAPLAVSTVVVRPGRTVSAVLHTTNGPIGGACRATGSYLRVYPPASTRSVLVPAAFRVCSGVFDVSPVRA